MSFEITERWLMDTGGWQAMKAARAAWQAGAVASAEFDGTRLRGQVRSGNRTLAAGMVIKSRTDVTNLCGCPVSRRDGAICEHSLAVGLAWTHRHDRSPVSAPRTPPPAAAPSNRPPAAAASSPVAQTTPTPAPPIPRTSGALAVVLPPTFFDGLRRQRLAVSLRPAPSTQPETESDRALHTWLASHQLSQVPPQIALSDRCQIESFLVALAGHPGVTCAGKPLAVAQGGWRMPLQVVESRENIKSSVANQGLKESNKTGADSRQAAARPARAARPESLPPLPEPSPADPLVLAPDPPALANTAWWAGPSRGFLYFRNQSKLQIIQELALVSPFFDKEGNSQAVPMAWAWLARHGDALSEVFEFDDTEARWPKLRLVPATPAFRLVLSGSRRRLVATLGCRYDGLPEFPLPGPGALTPDPFPLRNPEEAGVFGERNIEAERDAVARLTGEGFVFEERDKHFVLNGEAAVLQFYAGELALLERAWTVVFEPGASAAFRDLERLTPQFREVATGNDWLSFDLSLVGTAGSSVSANDARRWLRTGQGTQRLPNGKLAVLAREALDDLEAVLRDLSPTQEHGHFRVAAAQRAYLESSVARAGAPAVVSSNKPETEKTQLANEWDRILRNYQQKGARWMLRLAVAGHGGILADEMGLGKTIQTLAVVDSLKSLAGDRPSERRPCLVVAPTSLLGNWCEEAARFAPTLEVLVVRSGERTAELAALGRADLVITSYQLLVRDLDHHRAVEYSAVFLDEAGFIRNPDTQAARAVRRLRARARFALTGTPIENSIRDLWAIMDFVLPGYLGRHDDFRTQYETAVEAGHAATRQRLRRRLAPYWLRRLKTEVARDLPAKIEKIIRCDLTVTQRDMYAAIQREGVRKVEEARQARTASQARLTLLTALLRLRQTCGDPRLLGESFPDRDPSDYSTKWAALIELLEEIRDGGHNVLIFSQFATQLSLLEPALTTVGLDFCRLDGTTRDREAQVNAFRENPAKRAFLISLKAGGFGLNLTKADTIIHFDPWWNPAVEAQATDRAHRIGQARPVTVYKLITTGTVEEKILALQHRKRQLMQNTLADDTAPLMDDLETAELQELLEG